MTDRNLRLLGWIATATAIFMYLSYIDQIRLNLAGDKGSIVQPVATVVNCALWVSYGYFRKVRDWPLVLANSPGVLLGFLTLVTAL
jgi:uncharacterized protein with PQ loop repeat